MPVPSVSALLVSVAVSLLALTGCGSDASTSPAQARTVAAAEQKFLGEWKQANLAEIHQCSEPTRRAFLKCAKKVVAPMRLKALREFTTAIKAVLASGVGPECADSLEETLYTMSSVSSFAGATAHICEVESRE